MKTRKENGKICEQCGSQNLKTHLTTYPIKMDTRQLNVGRVSVKECLDCHHLKPTKAGQEKIERCMMNFMIFLGE
jgi:hypothetical protein